MNQTGSQGPSYPSTLPDPWVVGSGQIITPAGQYGAPNADISQSNFGVITTTISNYATGRGTPRELQISAKFLF